MHDDYTFRVWVYLMLQADAEGNVDVCTPAIARACGESVCATEQALDLLSSIGPGSSPPEIERMGPVRLRFLGQIPLCYVPDGRIPRVKIPEDIQVAVWERDGGRCRQCGSVDRLEFDHIHPYSLGGQDTLENLQLLCKSCNCRKGARIQAGK